MPRLPKNELRSNFGEDWYKLITHMAPSHNLTMCVGLCEGAILGVGNENQIEQDTAPFCYAIYVILRFRYGRILTIFQAVFQCQHPLLENGKNVALKLKDKPLRIENVNK